MNIYYITLYIYIYIYISYNLTINPPLCCKFCITFNKINKIDSTIYYRFFLKKGK